MTKIMAILIGVAALVSGANASDKAGNSASARVESGYTYGPVTQVGYIHVEYGHFDEYLAWVASTWVPTMQALKKAGLIIDYKVFRASPKSPDQPNIYLEITYKDMAAYAGDIGDNVDAFEAVTEKVICSSACQDAARVDRKKLRTFLGSEVTRELIFK